jgi:SNF2 family DNA or RNA helicase
MLVFTQFKEIVEPLGDLLADVFGRPGLALSGDTAVARRKTLVKTFQEDERAPFFVLSLKAGGSGLNLTAAAHVVHFDRWWNPAVENQATDRAFRIGQKRNVLVHKFVCRGTIEERIDRLIESKQRMADDMLAGDGEINLTELADADLMALVRLDLDAASKEG